MASLTRRWISADGAPGVGVRAWVSRGLSATSGGQSHSWVTPTSSSPSPSAQTISVADGRRDAIRTPRSVPADDGGSRRSAGLERVDLFARCGAIGVPGRVDLGVLGPLGREALFGEDRVDRALGFARAAVDAFVGVDEQLAVHALIVVDAVDGTDRHARDVENVDARLGDHVGHLLLPGDLRLGPAHRRLGRLSVASGAWPGGRRPICAVETPRAR